MVVSVKHLEIRAAKTAIQLAADEMGLNNSQLALAIGVTPRTLYRYKNGENAPSPEVVEELGKIREISQLLNDVFKDETAQFDWLYRSVPLLRGKRPIDLIKKGELEKVISILSGLQSGAFI